MFAGSIELEDMVRGVWLQWKSPSTKNADTSLKPKLNCKYISLSLDEHNSLSSCVYVRNTILESEWAVSNVVARVYKCLN